MPGAPFFSAVEGVLKERADRGVLRVLDSAKARGGKREIRLQWFGPRPLRLILDPAKRSLAFRDLLPNLPAGSPMYADLRAFLTQRHSLDLPAHRRLDAARIQVKCANRKGNVSISATQPDGDVADGAREAIRLVNEIFLGFLRGPYYEYMSANFDEPQE